MGSTWWRFYFQLFPRAIKAPQIIEFLQLLMRYLRRPLLLICSCCAPVAVAKRLATFRRKKSREKFGKWRNFVFEDFGFVLKRAGRRENASKPAKTGPLRVGAPYPMGTERRLVLGSGVFG